MCIPFFLTDELESLKVSEAVKVWIIFPSPTTNRGNLSSCAKQSSGVALRMPSRIGNFQRPRQERDLVPGCRIKFSEPKIIVMIFFLICKKDMLQGLACASYSLTYVNHWLVWLPLQCWLSRNTNEVYVRDWSQPHRTACLQAPLALR